MMSCTRCRDSFMRSMTVACISMLLSCFLEASTASFDCARAQGRVEKAICGDAGLSQLDVHLARYYAAAGKVSFAPSRCFISTGCPERPAPA